jgi:serine O-acetyltransferase
VVLQDVPEHVTVVGVPARVVGKPKEETPSLEMNQNIEGA